MADGNGDKYVTWRDLGTKLDDVDAKIGKVGDKADEAIVRLTRIETWMRLAPFIVGILVAFGPEAAKALPFP